MADWSEIPWDLLGMISGRVTLADQIRMAAVCKLWRLAMADGNRRRPPVPSMWLIIPRNDENGLQSYRFAFSRFMEGTTRRFTLTEGGWVHPSLKYARVVGSSQGWLMMQDKLPMLHAYHPVSRTRLSFSPNMRRLGIGSWAYRKAVLVPARGGGSYNPPLASVLWQRISQDMTNLAFAVAGNDEWKHVPMAFPVEDIAAHDGRLYALHKGSRVLVCDFGDGRSASLAPVYDYLMPPPPLWGGFESFIGIMSGELILLKWASFLKCLYGDGGQHTVLRLERAEGQQPTWVYLQNLAGHALVLGADGFTALRVEEFPELEPDCIYSVVAAADDVIVSRGIVVVNMVTGEVRFEPESRLTSLNFWFRPTENAARWPPY